MPSTWLLACCFCIALHGQEATHAATSHQQNDSVHRSIVASGMKLVKNVIYNKGFFMKELQRSLQQAGAHITPQCAEDVAYLLDIGEENHTSYSTTFQWQKQMLDAFGSMGGGLIEGNLFWMGDFSQCTDIKVWKNTNTQVDTRPSFTGKYCVPNFNHYITPDETMYEGHFPIIFTSATCFPSTCLSSDIENIVNAYISPLKVKISDNECQTSESESPDLITIAGLMLFGVFGSLLIVGTLCEIVPLMRNAVWPRNGSCDEPKGKLKTFLLAFSGYNNTKRLFNVQDTRESMTCINGMRAISISFVVSGHMAMFVSSMCNGRHNPMEFTNLQSLFLIQPLIKTPLCVTTFFFLTGFLVTYTVMTKGIELKRFNALYLYIHRLWRLAPSVILLATFVAGPFQMLGNGPLWNSSPFYIKEVCRASWWKTVLSIGIYYEDQASVSMCVPHLWYLQVDIFFCVLSPIILYPFVREHWSSMAIWITAFVASTMARWSVVEDINNLYPNADYQSWQIRILNHQWLTTRPWCRAQPFLLGMLFAYFFYYRGKEYKLRRTVKGIIWALVAVTMMGIVYLQYIFQELAHDLPPLFLQNVDVMFSETLWSLCIGWITWACVTGSGGIVNDMLSWKFFVPLGRLSFCEYIIHFNMMALFGLSTREPLYTDYKFVTYAGATANAISLPAAWLLCLMVEAPSIRLENMLRERALKAATTQRAAPNDTKTRKQPKYVVVPVDEAAPTKGRAASAIS